MGSSAILLLRLVCLLVWGSWLPGSHCLKDVTLQILPPVVQKGQGAALICKYDLEGDPLYSVKWYRGRHEFYRYSPEQNPSNMFFPFTGVDIDMASSNESVVVLQDIDFAVSGNFSCEVTVDTPTFSTKTVTEQMLVVALPESAPILEIEKDQYQPGDTLRANCSAPPSKPPANLTFLINNIPIDVSGLQHHSKEDTVLQSSTLSLSIQLLPLHFNDGDLVLKCTAYLTNLYQESSEVYLGIRATNPVPQRVTAPNRTSRVQRAAIFNLLLFVTGCLGIS